VTRRALIALLLLFPVLLALPSEAGAACAGQSNGGAAAAAQERTMLCLVNQARTSRGLEPLTVVKALDRAADRKSGDILRCDESAMKLADETSPTG